MAEKIITLSIPEALYERIQFEAEDSHQPFEAVMLDQLSILFERIDVANDVDKALDALDNFKDYELWAIVSRRLSTTNTDQLHILGSEEKRSSLSAEEKRQLDQLLGQVNRDMLLRSKALMLLKERGHDITAYVKTGI